MRASLTQSHGWLRERSSIQKKVYCGTPCCRLCQILIFPIFQGDGYSDGKPDETLVTGLEKFFQNIIESTIHRWLRHFMIQLIHFRSHFHFAQNQDIGIYELYRVIFLTAPLRRGQGWCSALLHSVSLWYLGDETECRVGTPYIDRNFINSLPEAKVDQSESGFFRQKKIPGCTGRVLITNKYRYSQWVGLIWGPDLQYQCP